MKSSMNSSEEINSPTAMQASNHVHVFTFFFVVEAMHLLINIMCKPVLIYL